MLALLEILHLHDLGGAVVILFTRRGRKLASATTRGRTVMSRTLIAGTYLQYFIN